MDQIGKLLMAAGLTRAQAGVLAFFLQHERGTVAEIKKGTGLPQPAISVAVRSFGSWLDAQRVSVGAKGKPASVYSLAVSPSVIVEDMRGRVERSAAAMMENISKLEAMVHGN